MSKRPTIQGIRFPADFEEEAWFETIEGRRLRTTEPPDDPHIVASLVPNAAHRVRLLPRDGHRTKIEEEIEWSDELVTGLVLKGMGARDAVAACVEACSRCHGVLLHFVKGVKVEGSMKFRSEEWTHSEARCRFCEHFDR